MNNSQLLYIWYSCFITWYYEYLISYFTLNVNQLNYLLSCFFKCSVLLKVLENICHCNGGDSKIVILAKNLTAHYECQRFRCVFLPLLLLFLFTFYIGIILKLLGHCYLIVCSVPSARILNYEQQIIRRFSCYFKVFKFPLVMVSCVKDL